MTQCYFALPFDLPVDTKPGLPLSGVAKLLAVPCTVIRDGRSVLHKELCFILFENELCFIKKTYFRIAMGI